MDWHTIFLSIVAAFFMLSLIVSYFDFRSDFNRMRDILHDRERWELSNWEIYYVKEMLKDQHEFCKRDDLRLTFAKLNKRLAILEKKDK